MIREKKDIDIANQIAWDIYHYFYGPQGSHSTYNDSFEFIFAKVLTALVDSKRSGQPPKMGNVWETGNPVHEQKGETK